MDERATSVVGLVFAILVVVGVMNAPILAEIIDDIRGVARVSPARNAPPGVSGRGGGSTLRLGGSSAARGAGAGDGHVGGGTGGGEGTLSAPSGRGGGGAEFWGHAATMEEGRLVPSAVAPPRSGDAGTRSSDAGRAEGGIPSASEGDAGPASPVGDGGAAPGVERPSSGQELRGSSVSPDDDGDAAVEGPFIPAVQGPRPPALALLRCTEELPPRLWLAETGGRTLSWPVDDALGPAIADSIGDRVDRPQAISFLSHGCGQEVVDGVRHTLSELCGVRLVGTRITDMATGRQLPLCGL